VENRAVDGSANPYLAMTGILAAGLDGIRNRLPAGERNDRNMYEVPVEQLKEEGIGILPSNLSEALDELEKSALMKEALGDHIFDHFLAAKREEWDSYIRHVSPWEIDRYLNTY
jgi:glutamine synthetase